MEPIAALQDLIRRHCPDGRRRTALPRLDLIRADRPTVPVQAVCEPCFCLVAQGGKRTILGDRVFAYGAGTYLLASVDLPVTGEVVEASPEAPYLALRLALDTASLASLLVEASPAAPATATAGLAVSPLTADLLDPVLRLLRLLDRPDDIATLAPLAERELLYRLLQGEQGTLLRQIALADSRLAQVSRAIAWIRQHYGEPLRIAALARIAGMSASSFHRHFKAVTTMSPLQFQKRVRLQEARLLLLSRDEDAGRIGFAVGYESPSQFSRDYRRLYGVPPGRDAARLRTLSAADRRDVAEPV